jgi:SAM-dependent methyltransferase
MSGTGRAKAAPALRRADVVLAYRWILGREPESEAAIEAHLGMPDVAALRARFLGSAEFRAQLPAREGGGLSADAPAMDVPAEADAAEIEAMLNRQRRLWIRLGEAAPHFSVLPEERFRPERIAANRAAFHATGRAERDLVEGVLARNGLEAGRFRRLVEFGCGVGRATLHLAALCPEVTGIDFSPPHLALARAEAKARGLDHIAWLRARPDLPMPAAAADLWVSRRVLQHNPPPVQAALLRLAFAALAPGGAALFQTLTYGQGYGFDTAAWLAGQAPAQPEWHALPQRVIFALAAEAGLVPLEVGEDPVPGLDRRRFVSHLFLMRRPG